MTFLDERIKFTVTVDNSISLLPDRGVYRYAIMAADFYSSHEEHEVFVGNFYYNHTFQVTLDVTDIIRNCVGNYKTIRDYLHNPYIMNGEAYSDGRIKEYWIRLTMQRNGTTFTRESTHKMVANVYRYPNGTGSAATTGTVTFPNYNNLPNSYNPLMQGYRYVIGQPWNRYEFIPRYPLDSTSNYAYSVTFGHGAHVSSIPIYMSDNIGDWDRETNFEIGQPGELYATNFTSALAELFEDYFYQVEHHDLEESDVDLYYTPNLSSDNVLIAKFEACHPRYYLQWMDRFGSIQSQPFRENITYSEDFETEEVISYDDIRRTSTIIVQPKWKLHSGWIPDKHYMYYESIFTSPFLILYDSETYNNFIVTVKGNYIEKNYKNQKSLVDLELNLEAATTQNFIY